MTLPYRQGRLLRRADRALLAGYGANEIESKQENPLLKLLTYFWGPIPWMIQAAVILSGMLRHWPDFGIILVLLLANAGIFMIPLGWHWAAVVWGYAIIWFLLTDRVKLAAYRILDPVENHGATHAGAPAPEPGTARDRPGKAAAVPVPVRTR